MEQNWYEDIKHVAAFQDVVKEFLKIIFDYKLY